MDLKMYLKNQKTVKIILKQINKKINSFTSNNKVKQK
jgi:hypothetical protein